MTFFKSLITQLVTGLGNTNKWCTTEKTFIRERMRLARQKLSGFQNRRKLSINHYRAEFGWALVKGLAREANSETTLFATRDKGSTPPK